MRILLVDDNANFRAALHAWLQTNPRFEIVGEAADEHEAIRLAMAANPEVVLMDVMLADGLSTSLTREILALCPSVTVFALSIHRDPVFVEEMLNAGAAAYLSKGQIYEELPVLLDQVIRMHRLGTTSPHGR